MDGRLHNGNEPPCRESLVESSPFDRPSSVSLSALKADRTRRTFTRRQPSTPPVGRAWQLGPGIEAVLWFQINEHAPVWPEFDSFPSGKKNNNNNNNKGRGHITSVCVVCQRGWAISIQAPLQLEFRAHAESLWPNEVCDRDRVARCRGGRGLSVRSRQRRGLGV